MKPIPIVLLALTMLLVACGSDGGSDATLPPGESPWAETTVPFDPTCARCEPLATVNVGHAGEVELMLDPAVDDPEAQWVGCVNNVLDCVEDNGELVACVATSSCPPACKAEFTRILHRQPTPESFDARWNALEAVFVEPTGLCSVDDHVVPIEVTP